jgi:hypothetical protein
MLAGKRGVFERRDRARIEEKEKDKLPSLKP